MGNFVILAGLTARAQGRGALYPVGMTDDLMAYAFRALAQRALTESELRARLARRGADDAAQERLIARLRELGYLNDAGVAQAVSARGGVGRFRVKAELKRRGVAGEVIDEALAGRDPDQDLEGARRLAERHRDRWSRARDPRATAYGFLARRGFEGSVIWAVLNELQLGQAGEETPEE